MRAAALSRAVAVGLGRGRVEAAVGRVATGVGVRDRAAAREAPPRVSLTRFHQRVYAEALTAAGGEGPAVLAPALAHSAIDLNPHQVEAAAFALSAMRLGGAVLADEVGLGKTIEAGLVMAQLAAEGRERVLVLVPASIRAQWKEELARKFGIEATLLDGEAARAAQRRGVPNPFDTGGAVVASHAFGALRADDLARVEWDLAVIDEAHRLRNAWRRDHRTGQALRRALRRAPKLLLTATPLQNDVMELLGLASFVDERLLGSEEGFRLQYASGDLTAEKAADLKARLAPVVARTLRRQVREYVRFTARRSLVEDFAPTPQERELYQKVSEYLRREDALAIPRGRRALLTLVYRKILASSSFALAATLDRLAASLEARLAGQELAAAAAPELEGFEEEAEEWEEKPEAAPAPSPVRRMRAELAELRRFARDARVIRENAKGQALGRGLDRAFTVARACGWPEKAVVFTEFRRTQEYLDGALRARGWSVTCLSGDVAGADRRQALVHEFRDRTQILLMTEAGAEGLNLQFCNLVVNYDLPWNPQRLEQRIGRCHRYGQARDVLVLNFLNRSNAADARLYELLSAKLALFDGVFGSSDEILGALGSGLDFERRVLDIYQSCRSAAEVDRAFDELRRDLEERIEARMRAARALLFERFDGEVRARLRLAAEEASAAAARREADEALLLASVFPRAPEAVAGPQPWSRRGRLVRAAAEAVRAKPQEAASSLRLEPGSLPARLGHLAGREGWWLAWRLAADGLVPEERVEHLVLWSDGADWRALAPEEAQAFAALAAREASDAPGPPAAEVGPAQETALAAAEARLLARARERSGATFDEARERWDRSAEEALLAPRRAVEEARAAWGRAREALRDPRVDLPARDRRGLLERAERDYRRKLEELRAAEALRYGEKDRALAELRRRADPRLRRDLVATAFWRCA